MSLFTKNYYAIPLKFDLSAGLLHKDQFRGKIDLINCHSPRGHQANVGWRSFFYTPLTIGREGMLNIWCRYARARIIRTCAMLRSDQHRRRRRRRLGLQGDHAPRETGKDPRNNIQLNVGIKNRNFICQIDNGHIFHSGNADSHLVFVISLWFCILYRLLCSSLWWQVAACVSPSSAPHFYDDIVVERAESNPNLKKGFLRPPPRPEEGAQGVKEDGGWEGETETYSKTDKLIYHRLVCWAGYEIIIFYRAFLHFFPFVSSVLLLLGHNSAPVTILGRV